MRKLNAMLTPLIAARSAIQMRGGERQRMPNSIHKERSMSNVLLKAFKTICLILTLGVSMSGCSSTMSWKEEVKLSDGRIIVVERDLLFEGGGDEWASNRSGEKPKEYRIRFTYPAGSGQIVEWRTTKKDSQTWPETPLIFDLESGQPTVFTLVAISSCCEVYSKYVYRNGAWIEEQLPEQFEQRTTNLFFGDGSDMPTFLNLEEKYRRNSEDVYRHALRQIGPNRQVRFPGNIQTN